MRWLGYVIVFYSDWIKNYDITKWTLFRTSGGLSSVCTKLESARSKSNEILEMNVLKKYTITQKMADRERFDLDVVFTIILCATNVFIW